MEPKKNSIINNAYVVTVIGGIVLWLFTDVIFKLELFSKAWTWLKSVVRNEVKVPLWTVLTFVAGIILLVMVIRWAKKKYFTSDLDTKVGHYTYKQLYQILETEKVFAKTLQQYNHRLGKEDLSLLHLYIGYHDWLSGGVDLDTNFNGLLYHVVCPKLHGYGLMERQLKEYGDPSGVTSNRYFLNDNSRLFWSILNKRNLQHRIQQQQEHLKK